MSIRINGVGTSLVDYLYSDVDFSGEPFRALLSQRPGDGGIVPGALTFVSDLERYTGRQLEELLSSVVGNRKPDSSNVGGPAVVALLHAAQLCAGRENAERHPDVQVSFFGAKGQDATADQIDGVLSNTPLDTSGYQERPGRTPVTYVLSDPSYAGGQGERSFINDIGAAWEYRPEDLPEHFFSGDIVLFGGTALVPRIHDGLTGLLQRAKEQGAFTIVNTVYDFRNQQLNPDEKWPLGESDESYELIDLLLCDREEALRLSGQQSVDAALTQFRAWGTAAAVVTQGANDTVAYAQEGRFAPVETRRFPVSARIQSELAEGAGRNGDTTGCGDNFVGGVVASIAQQLEWGGPLELTDAIALGTASGGFTCFYMGGTYGEQHRGEKWERIEPYYRECRERHV
jgi:sugar/nucleoside kinase (ribokinase family)